jgi:hypothetical protein
MAVSAWTGYLDRSAGTRCPAELLGEYRNSFSHEGYENQKVAMALSARKARKAWSRC